MLNGTIQEFNLVYLASESLVRGGEMADELRCMGCPCEGIRLCWSTTQLRSPCSDNPTGMLLRKSCRFMPCLALGLGKRMAIVSRCPRASCFVGSQGSYLVDPASSHMLVSKIKPCMSKYKLLIL